jgi:membrane-bound serine protease (ClpP class)
VLLVITIYLLLGFLVAFVRIFRDECTVFVSLFPWGVGGVLLTLMAWPLLLVVSIGDQNSKERLALEEEVIMKRRQTEADVQAEREVEFRNRIARVHSSLRPSGKIDIEGRIFDARTDGQFLEKGTAVTVDRQELGAFVVRQCE